MGLVEFVSGPETARTDVVVGPGIRTELTDRIQRVLPDRRFAVVVDANVGHHWGDELRRLLPQAKDWITLPPGEQAKSSEQLVELCRKLVRCGLTRSDFVVTIGGGAVCDVGALAASLHLRGVPVVLVPTTLLAMVDAGLGGKCAINLPEGKNLLGHFHVASLLLCDPELLTTLPDRELAAGMGEVLKYAIGFSTDLLATLEACSTDLHGLFAHDDGLAIIRACLEIKSRIVTRDLTEASDGDRILLNLGHTTAHVLETVAGGQLAHGLAVAIGLRVACRLAARRGWLSDAEVARARACTDRFGLPFVVTDVLPDFERPTEERIRAVLARDKKSTATGLRIVLPQGLGHCTVTDADVDELAAEISDR